MVIRILPTQVAKLWEQIKFACVQADEVRKEDMPFYFNELLHALLSEKAQCFIRLDNDRTLLLLMITRILADKINGKKFLFIQALYSWKGVDNKEWQNDFKFIKEFAEHEKCKYISFESRNQKVWQLAESLGFRENLRKFTLNMEG